MALTRSELTARWRKKNLAKGNCAICTRKAEPGMKRCKDHLALMRKQNNDRTAEARKNGMCTRHPSRKAQERRKLCSDCLADQRARNRKTAAAKREAHV